ncbi:MAG: hypothetical protein GY705_03100 [Bacteroidetes bacterium]|nr:hypothetical protein [Bacteroidota bacterium]
MAVLVNTISILRDEAFSKLEAVHDNKTKALNDYFDNAFNQVDILAQSRDVKVLYKELKRYHDMVETPATGAFDITTTEYKELCERYGKELSDFQKNTGYYDIFLICAKHGHVMYSATKESDLGSERQQLNVVIIVPHEESVIKTIDALPDQGLRLNNLKNMYDKKALSANIVLDTVSNIVSVEWNRNNGVVFSSSHDSHDLATALKYIISEGA